MISKLVLIEISALKVYKERLPLESGATKTRVVKREKQAQKNVHDGRARNVWRISRSAVNKTVRTA